MWLFNCKVLSDSLRPHGLQQARLLCPSLAPGVCSNSPSSSRLEKCEPPSFGPEGLCLQTDLCLQVPGGGRYMARLGFLHCHHTPVYHGVPNDATYFLSPAVIPSWIWGLFPQMVDSLRKIFKHSNLPQRRSLCETGFCKVCAAVVSSSQGNPQKYLGVKKKVTWVFHFPAQATMALYASVSLPSILTYFAIKRHFPPV